MEEKEVGSERKGRGVGEKTIRNEEEGRERGKEVEECRGCNRDGSRTSGLKRKEESVG